MTQTANILPKLDTPDTAIRKHPAWQPLAQEAIRRLQDAVADRATRTWNLALEGLDDNDIPEFADTAAEVRPSALELLNQSPSAMNITPEEFDAIAAAGGDPTATADDGSCAPRIRLPARRLIALIRLAASIGSQADRDAMLAPGAITVIGGIPDALVDLVKSQLCFALPSSCSVASSSPASNSGEPYLITLVPDVLNGKIGKLGQSAFAKALAEAVDACAPILVLLPAAVDRPDGLDNELVRHSRFSPLSLDVLIAALRETHSATGRIDEAAVRAALPTEPDLSDLDPVAISLAMRAPTARQVAEQIAAITGKATVAPDLGPWLEDIHGDTPALRAARQIVRDLRGWKTGDVSWRDLTRTLLLYGPPGTGKSWIARAMGNSAGFNVVTGTFGQWQSEGHLGDMLGAMRKTFAEARSKAPCVLIIDEIDAVGSREDRERHNYNYKVQVINAFLAAMDSISHEEGVVVVGTCNHPEQIDPAVMRAGRFDMKIALPLPDADSLFGLFRHSLPDWREADLRDLAAGAVGCSAADVDATIRQARAVTRAKNRELTPTDLRNLFQIGQPPEIDRRIALHECGHAILCAALRIGPVTRVMIDREGGGGVTFNANAKHGTIEDLRDRLCQMMAGRAAEQLVLGSISAGAGGAPDSDLAKATTLACAIHTQYGLGIHGPTWLGGSDVMLLRDPTLLSCIRREVSEAEKRARAILIANRPILEAMAAALMRCRDMDEAESQHWLGQVGQSGACPDKTLGTTDTGAAVG